MSGTTMVRLRDLGTWMGGNTPSKSKAEYWDNGSVPWVSPKDMKVDEIHSSEDQVSALALTEGRASLLPPGTVLVVTRSGILSHTLPVAVTQVPVTINQDLKALTPKRGVSPKYVAHALRGASGKILKQCSKHGTTVASVETSSLLDFQIPMVALDEQLRIVAEIEKQFSRLDEAVANLQRVMANVRRYKAAVLRSAVEGRLVETEASIACREGRCYESGEQLLQRTRAERRAKWSKGKYIEPDPPEHSLVTEVPDGWTRATVAQLAQTVEYGLSSKTSEDSGGLPVLRMGNIYEGELRFDELKYLPRDHDEFPKLLLEDGDLLFNRTNSPELVGKVAVYRRQSVRHSFASYLIRVRLLSGAVPEYVAACINSSFGRRWIKSVVTQQVGQANVNGTKLQALSLPLPPLAEQLRIVAELDRRLSIAREFEAEVGADLKRAHSLRQAILAKAFSGAPS